MVVSLSTMVSDQGFFVNVGAGMSHNAYSKGFGYDRADQPWHDLFDCRWCVAGNVAVGLEDGYANFGSFSYSNERHAVITSTPGLPFEADS